MSAAKLNLAQYRVRVIFRCAFATLAIATLAMAISVLQEEKQLSYSHYRDSLGKTQAQIMSKLHHPSGQLALFNPRLTGQVTPLHPLLLPFAAIDFDDRYKVQQAIEMAGCLVHYPNQASVCTAVGNNPWSGGYIYIAGGFISRTLVPKQPRSGDFTQAHRMQVTLVARGETWRWIAPFELSPPNNPTPKPGAKKNEPAPAELPSEQPAVKPKLTAQQGRLTGFALAPDDSLLSMLPVRDFRGWIWQEAPCLPDANATGQNEDCPKRTFFSIRLPVEMFHAMLLDAPEKVVWPPVDLPETQVHLHMWGPVSDTSSTGELLLDSNASGATPPFALSDLQSLLLPGETLEIRQANAAANAPPMALIQGEAKQEITAYPQLNRLVNRLIRRLPSNASDQPLNYQDTISTPMGDYQLRLHGDERSVDRALGAVATRIAWYVGAMLLAIALAQVVIELAIIRRIALLTRRANAVAQSVHELQQIGQFKLNDLRGSDELGILAGCLSDLLQRIDDDVRRAHIRAAQEKDMWHAVGHEIMSPLQSLLALHSSDSNSHRYLLRMQQAIKVLYGSASPSEALQSSSLQLASLDLRQFLNLVAANAPSAGISQVEFHNDSQTPLMVRADEYSLEDVVTHVLTNAQHFRTPGTPIHMYLSHSDTQAQLTIHNQGPQIDPAFLEQIFEYGVSNPTAPSALKNEHRGQGLFVARTYMAKMGGRIWAENTQDGARMVLSLELAGRQEGAS